MTNTMLLERFEALADAPNGIPKLRKLILQMAVHGKLVPQDRNDEPASELLKRIREEKQCLIAEGVIRKQKPTPALGADKGTWTLPVNWAWTRTGEVAYLVRGITFPASAKSKHRSEDRIACLRTTNVQGEVMWDDLLYVSREYVRHAAQSVRARDLMISLANSYELVGKVALVREIPEEAAFGGFIGALRTAVIPPAYLLHLFRSPYMQSKLRASSSQTTNIANISLKSLNPIPIPIPPLAEQKRIVSKVDELMALCDDLEIKQQAKRTKQISLNRASLHILTEPSVTSLATAWHRVRDHFDHLYTSPEAVSDLRQTILQLAVMGRLVPQDPTDEPASELLKKIQAEKHRLIAEGTIRKPKLLPPIAPDERTYEPPNGWEWSRLEDISDKITDGEHISPAKTNVGVMLLTAKHVLGHTISTKDPQFVAPDDARHFRLRCDPLRGDVLICSRGTIGRSAVVDTDEIFCLMGSVIQLRANECMNSGYVHRLLSTSRAQEWMSSSSGATAVKALYLKDIRACPIPVPPAAEQVRIVAKVDELMTLCNNLESKLQQTQTDADNLLTAIAHEMVGNSERREG